MDEQQKDKVLNGFDGHDNLTDGELMTIWGSEDLIDVDKTPK